MASYTAGMELHISLIGRKDLGGEIYRQLRRAILEGQLRPGDPLPPSRELARQLTVSRTTVTGAYDRLAGEGFVTIARGRGHGRQRASGACAKQAEEQADRRLAAPAARLGCDPAADRASPSRRVSTSGAASPMQRCSRTTRGDD